MNESDVMITTADGEMGSFITYPEEGGPFPVILFLMDAPGKREELHMMARRIASVGYYVVLPNLYYRRTDQFQVDGSEASRRVMFEHMNSLSNQMVAQDCRAILSFTNSQPEAAHGAAGAVGYCMSGPFALYLAGVMADRIKASASIHGVRLYTDADDSPHLQAQHISGEVYIACAETDEYAPPEMIASLQDHLSTLPIDYRVEWYPGTEHGFVFPDRVGKYHMQSAERHWERLFAMFDRRLR